jgi:hypothetical protein
MGKSGHSGGTGVLKDYEKLYLAAESGWQEQQRGMAA